MAFKIRLIKRYWSSESRIWKFSGKLASAWWARSSLWANPWKVPIHILFRPRPINDSIRPRISFAALLVKVTARMENGAIFSTSINHAMRCTNTRVLPLPAPANMRALERGAATASRCLSLSSSSSRDTSIIWST